jgi:hypothetical protein
MRMVRVNVALAVFVLLFISVVVSLKVIGGGSSVPPADPVTTPSATAPVPRGSGSRVADDVNGDGYADLVFAAPHVGAESAYLGVVYGSARGLDPAVRTVMEPGDTRLPPDQALEGVRTAHLDDDGYADILVSGHVIWGGPTGPREAVRPAKLPIGGVPGDFDGDGQEDLAVVGGDEGNHLRVLYGPFTREGRPRRTGAARPSPVGGGYEDDLIRLTAGDADGDRATDLVATANGDGEQTPSALLHGGAGPGGFRARPQELRVGSSVAFGDFDGDGKGDIAAGDSGSRNNEPGNETESSEVDGTVTVYYGGSRPAERFKPGATGNYSTGDLDHDGRDELLISYLGGVTILHGSAGGLTTDGSTTLRRNGGGKEVPASERPAQLVAVQDFDQDGRAEVVFKWSREDYLSYGGLEPSRWWVIEGGSDEVAAFTDAKFAD